MSPVWPLPPVTRTVMVVIAKSNHMLGASDVVSYHTTRVHANVQTLTGRVKNFPNKERSSFQRTFTYFETCLYLTMLSESLNISECLSFSVAKFQKIFGQRKL